jgi:hypothetical protein
LGQVVQAPGAPVPIRDVTVSVIDPVADPSALAHVRTDDLGRFQLGNVHSTAGGRIRLFIDGTTGGGGPFVIMNTEYPVSPNGATDLGVVHLTPMDPNAIVRITPDNATISHAADGRVIATLKGDIALAGGAVPGESQSGEPVQPRTAQLRIPSGAALTFPLASPLLVNITRIDLSSIPAPMPKAMDGAQRFTQYFVTLQPSGLELGAPIGLQLPELDNWDAGMPVDFWEVDTSTETFVRKAGGSVSRVPGFGRFAVSDGPFVSRFGWYAATPPCTPHKTPVGGRTIDEAGMPVAGATVRLLGLRAQTGADGRFSIPDVPLGCDPTIPTLTVLASIQRNDGTFLSGASDPTPPVVDMPTDFGDITLKTPLYVLRAHPDSTSGAPIDTSFDVYFSEPVDPQTITAVAIAQVNVTDNAGMCITQTTLIEGLVQPDDADATHVRFVPSGNLAPGQAFVGQVLASGMRARSGHVMVSDFTTPFTTFDTAAPTVDITQPQSDGMAVISGATIAVTGTADDGAGIASGHFQLYQAGPNGGTQGAPIVDVPATLTANDPCTGDRSVHLTAAIQVPAGSQMDHVIRLLASDTSGNEAHIDRVVALVPPGQAFPFCGTAQPVAYVASNGFITFDQVDYDYTPTVQKFFARPRVSAFYTDVDLRSPIPARNFWNVLPGADPAFVVTWLNVGLYPGRLGPDTFQIALFRSGAIQVSFEAMADTVSSTAGADPQDFFVGVSCPGGQSNAPPRTNLLTPQSQPDTMNEGRDFNPWNGEPIYDFLDRSVMPVPTVSSLFATRYFNFVPPGAQAPAFVPIFQDGADITGNLCDDCGTAIPITFTTGPDGGVPDGATRDSGAAIDGGPLSTVGFGWQLLGLSGAPTPCLTGEAVTINAGSAGTFGPYACFLMAASDVMPAGSYTVSGVLTLSLQPETSQNITVNVPATGTQMFTFRVNR